MNNTKRCTKCANERKRYAENRERERERSRKYRAENPENNRKYYAENSERIYERVHKWRKENPDKHNANNARRRATKLQATPPWALTGHEKLTTDQFYSDAALLNEIWGWDLEVDHVIPLTPVNESAPQGLHVSWNLQLLDGSQNASKSNNWLWVPPAPVFHRVAVMRRTL